jgi:hypothetical protein
VIYPIGDPRIGSAEIAAPRSWRADLRGYALHHIIPKTILRDAWDRLVTVFLDSQWPEARTAVRQYLLLCGVRAPNLENLIDRIRAVQRAQRRASHHELPLLESYELEPIRTAVIWPPWDLVAGPEGKFRADDPELVNRDRFDRFTTGLTVAEAARMREIDSLFRQIQLFLTINPTTPASLRTFVQEVNRCRQTLGDCSPIPYRPDMWTQDPDGKWRKARAAGGG